MKKAISLFAVLAIVVGTAFAFAGCTNEMVEQSKLMVEEYYESFEDGDAGEIVDLLSDDFIDSLEGKDKAEIIFGSRIGLLGEDFEYDIVGTSYNKNTSGAYVIIDVEVTYDRDGEMYEESFQFEKVDDELKITGASLDDEKVIEEILDSFIEAYNDGNQSALEDLFSDGFLEYIPAEDLEKMIYDWNYVLGDIEDLSVDENWALNIDYGEELVVTEDYYDVDFEYGDAQLMMQLCRENDEIKIYNILCIPNFMDATIQSLFEKMGQGDFDGANALYDDVFFDYTDGGKDGWAQMLAQYASYGEYSDYTISDWMYQEVTLDDGTVIPTALAVVYTQFGETEFYNEVNVIIDGESPKIIGHYFEID